MKRVPIFKPCDMEYSQYDKPIRYTKEFLKELASNTTSCVLVKEEHRGENIGEVSNFTFIDGELFANVSTEHSLDNLSYSPSYDCSLIDKGDYWLATKGKMLEVALTSNPRQALLNNTREEGGSTMANETDNETIKILNGQIKDLNKQLAIAENKNKANEEKLSKFDEMEKELVELRKNNETNLNLIEEQKPIVEKYNQLQEIKKEELVEKLSNGNNEIKAKLQDKSLEDLEMQEELMGLHHHDQPAKGIGSNNAEGLNEGNGETDEDAEQTARVEAVEGMFGDLFTKEE